MKIIISLFPLSNNKIDTGEKKIVFLSTGVIYLILLNLNK